MSNAGFFHITKLVANAAIPAPEPDVLDTGTDPVTMTMLYIGIGRTVFEFKNTAAADLTVAALDDVVGEMCSLTLGQNEVGIFGPFGRHDGRTPQGDRMRFTFTPASGTIGAEIRAYTLPANV
jgi:hypothetical protein